MNHIGKRLFLVGLALWRSSSMACPSCVGTVNNDSEPFFSDECYQSPSVHPTSQTQEPQKGDSHE